MAVIFGGDTGLRKDAFDDMIDGVLGEFNRIKDGLTNNFNRLSGKPAGLNPIIPKENVHVDDGFQNVPGTVFTGSSNIGDIDDIQNRKITTQSPTFTVYIKKKIFWSLRNEHDTKFMDAAEKLFLRATKLMFERKCAQIASYEAMTKLERLLDEESELDIQNVEQVRDIIRTEILGEAVDRVWDEANVLATNPFFDAKVILNNAANNAREIKKNAEQIVKELDDIIGRARQSKQVIHTTWVTDQKGNTDNIKIGRGVGVIELTLVDSVRTSLSLETGSLGSVSFTAQDPYNLMTITNTDIELALSAAIRARAKDSDPNMILNEPIETRGAQDLLEEARRKDEELKRIRNNRLSNLTFNLTQNTNILGGSNLAEIVFEINPSSVANDKVTGRITSLSDTFNKDNYRTSLLQLPLEQQLTSEEDNLVSQIFDLLESYVTAINTISNASQVQDHSEDAEYARRQLRKYYLGKSIVQPMDGVHIYIRGNTFRDAELIGPLSALLHDSPFVKSFAGGLEPDGLNDTILREEMRQFNIKNVPVNVYRKIRTSSLLRNAGAHVFGGLVSNTSSSYNASRGEYTLQVSGESNMKWLKLSRVNVAPSLDQPRGVLEDPLTPLKLETDPSTGLILGNSRLSDENKKRLLFYKDGSLRGKRLEEQNMLQDLVTLGDKPYAVRQHAPGLVYRWKEGVISATQQQSLRTSLRGGSSLIQKLRRDVGVTITKDGPFANLDVADVVSLLITGVPHNYESFFLNAISVGSFAHGGEANSPESYFHSFFDITRSTNRALGNFVPFKQIDVTPKQMAERLRIQADLIRENSEVSRLQSELAEAQDKFNHLPEGISSSAKNTLSNIIKDRESKLNTLTESLAQSISDGEKEGLRVYGNDIIVENTDTNPSSSSGSQESAERNRLRTQLVQLRTQLDTKLNTDTNLFIVSDEYDKDLDIQALVTELNSGEVPLWNSQYKNPIETCINAAQIIDFELFCMAKDTVVLTMSADGKIESKFVENFKNGDKVLSINQNNHSVCWKHARLLKRKLLKSEKMFAVRDGQGNTLKLSDQHKLLDYNLNKVSVKNLKPGDTLGTANKLPNIEKEIYIDVNKLFVNHKWYKDLGNEFKIKGQGSKCNPIPKSVKLDKDISWLFGMYIAEGSISDPENRVNKNSRGYHTIFSLSYEELEIANKISKIIEEKFNIKSNIYMYKKYNRCSVVVGSFVFSKIIKNIFGRTLSDTKKIPNIIWNATNENKLACLGGILVGDGTYKRRLSISSKSKFLLNDISQMLLMLNIDSKIDKYNKIHIYGKENILRCSKYTIGWKYNEEIKKYCNSDNLFKNRKKVNKFSIKDIREIEYDDFVYDLEVEDNHTFLLGHTWSHNCDSQGNIQFRPPQYNKIPLSLLAKMLLISENKSIELLPPFVKSLFLSRRQSLESTSTTLLKEIQVINLELFGSEDGKGEFTNIAQTKELFNLNEVGVLGLTQVDSRVPDKDTKLDSVAKRIQKLKNQLAIENDPTFSVADESDRFATIEKEVKELNDPKTPNVNVRRLEKLNRLVQLTSQKQRVDDTLKKMVSSKIKQQTYNATINNATRGLGTTLLPGQVKTLLEPFGNLLEDDYNDFLGPGSSKRFTIYDSQIISYDFKESDANVHCRVDVTGQQDLLGESPGQIGGIPILWAGATDFDLWKQYGWRQLSSVNKPYFKNAETQCAPYALMLLSLQRRDAVRATITVVGNEFYQLGDVVYINSKDMLYYVYSVSHNIGFGGTFTTTLDLRYGHPLGEFIPTPLDVIGKNIIKNQRKFNTTFMYRSTAGSEKGRCAGVILFAASDTTGFKEAEKQMLNGDIGEINLRELKNALLRINVQKNTKVDIRGFIRNESQRSKVEYRMQAIEEWLKSPISGFNEDDDPIQLDSEDFVRMEASRIKKFNNELRPILIPEIPEDDSDATIELEPEDIGRSPSEESYNLLSNPSDLNCEFNTIEIVLVFEEE